MHLFHFVATETWHWLMSSTPKPEFQLKVLLLVSVLIISTLSFVPMALATVTAPAVTACAVPWHSLLTLLVT